MYAGIKCILKNCFNFVYTQKCLKEAVATKKKQKNQKRKNPVPKVSSREFLVVVRRSHFLQRRTEEREVDQDLLTHVTPCPSLLGKLRRGDDLLASGVQATASTAGAATASTADEVVVNNNTKTLSQNKEIKSMRKRAHPDVRGY